MDGIGLYKNSEDTNEVRKVTIKNNRPFFRRKLRYIVAGAGFGVPIIAAYLSPEPVFLPTYLVVSIFFGLTGELIGSSVDKVLEATDKRKGIIYNEDMKWESMRRRSIEHMGQDFETLTEENGANTVLASIWY